MLKIQSTHKNLELISDYSKAVWHRLIFFLHSNNEKKEIKVKHRIPFILTSKLLKT
jgi:hypothetical protein